ncbi:MAG: peptidase C15 [Cyanobacteria bacterium P01_A01_bin.114]
MADTPILITSFQPWRAHQTANSSNVLLSGLTKAKRLPPNTVWLSELVVNFELAPTQVINQICIHQPRLVICCGMAETRSHLTLEAQGSLGDHSLQTPLDVSALAKDAIYTQVSQDAGRFVCNHLYYRVLEYIKRHHLPCQALFIHVPALTPRNRAVIEFDFLRIVWRLGKGEGGKAKGEGGKAKGERERRKGRGERNTVGWAKLPALLEKTNPLYLASPSDAAHGKSDQ